MSERHWRLRYWVRYLTWFDTVLILSGRLILITLALFEVACLSMFEMCVLNHYVKSYGERLIFKLKHCDIAR